MSSPPPQPIDFGFLPLSFRGDVQVFTSNNLNLNWQSWVKPRGISMVYMLAIGGGGGGGNGFTRTAGNAGGGGGGGASGSVVRAIIPAYFLPDVLYLQIGVGGRGGAGGGGSGETGRASTVSLGRSTANPNLIVLSSEGSGGVNGTSSGAALAGQPSAGLVGVPPVLGLSATLTGQAGGAGGNATGANGSAVTSVWNAVPTSGGAGGAGCTTTNFNGGAITLQGTPDFAATSLTGGVGGSGAGAGGDGSGGIQLWQPFYTTGGSGGGSNNSGTAGAGGKGGIGSGGGGGGAGATGGRGGDGGNGLVLVCAW